MNTLELSHFLRRDGYVNRAFQGIYPIDRLPSQVYYPCAIVINTDTAEGAGKHWIALYIDSFQVGVFFNSFGVGPTHQSVREFLVKHTVKWTYSNVQIQGVLSITCGLYCLYFLHQVARGVSVPWLLRPFDRLDLWRNDIWITDWINQERHKHHVICINGKGSRRSNSVRCSRV